MKKKPKITAEYYRRQNDQLHHLLEGGTLTKKQVMASGLGEGVLIEIRYRDRVPKVLLGQALETLDAISMMRPKRLAQRLASASANFIREMREAQTFKVPERK